MGGGTVFLALVFLLIGPSSQFGVSAKANETLTIRSQWNNQDSIEVELPKELLRRFNDLVDNSSIPQLRKQVPSNPTALVVRRSPCECSNGLCKCCTGVFFSILDNTACMRLRYIPDDLGFDFKMSFNDRVLFNRRVTGRNPPPVCISVPRLPSLRMCAKFHDLYFVGKDMHICLDVGASYSQYNLFDRPLDCMNLGMSGVSILDPNDSGGTSALVDQGSEEIEDYDDIV